MNFKVYNCNTSSTSIALIHSIHGKIITKAYPNVHGVIIDQDGEGAMQTQVRVEQAPELLGGHRSAVRREHEGSICFGE